MATISSLVFVRHVRGEPTAHLVFFKNGRVRRSGRGLAFWFSPLGASLAEIPLDDRELPFLFHARAADFQDVTVQGVVTYRVVAPEVLAQRVDFAIDTRSGQHARASTSTSASSSPCARPREPCASSCTSPNTYPLAPSGGTSGGHAPGDGLADLAFSSGRVRHRTPLDEPGRPRSSPFRSAAGHASGSVVPRLGFSLE